MDWTVERIALLTKKARRHRACKGNLEAAEKAVAEGDIEGWLAIARGNVDWVKGKLAVGIEELGDGPARGFYESGAAMWEGTYKDGKLHGLARRFYESGAVAWECTYKNGELVG